jgi:drug/metabolite transporter (DMT)-like permease
MISRAWAMFWVVALIWGSSFLLIRVGVGEMSPSQVVFIRCLIAAIGLNAVLLLRRKRYPTDAAMWRNMAIIGVINASLPYLLLGIGEQNVPSNVASVLQATTALFTMVIAHFVMTDERMTWGKVIGIVLGFVGMVILASRSQSEGAASIIGALSIVGASFSYSVGAVFSRRSTRGKVEPIVIAATSFIFAAVSAFFYMLLEPLLGGRAAVPLADISQNVVLSVLALGFFNTFIAYLFFYYIIQELGAARATMVTYVVPVVGLILGGLVLGERIDAMLIFGAALIFAGIGIANVSAPRLMAWLRPRPVA